jgi:hypothetical protein
MQILAYFTPACFALWFMRVQLHKGQAHWCCCGCAPGLHGALNPGLGQPCFQAGSCLCACLVQCMLVLVHARSPARSDCCLCANMLPFAPLPLALQITCGDSEPVSNPGLRSPCPNGTEFNTSAANLPASHNACCQVSTLKTCSPMYNTLQDRAVATESWAALRLRQIVTFGYNGQTACFTYITSHAPSCQ